MVQLCSCCFQQCENVMESGIVQLENEVQNSKSSSTINLTQKSPSPPAQQHFKMIGANSSRCLGLGVLIPNRSARSFKNLCFLTALLTFCVGIGVGILIPLCLMPKAESLARPFSSNSSRSANDVHYDYERQYVNSMPMLLRREGARSTAPPVPVSLFMNGMPPTPSSDEDISNRFPEFAQIQALVQHDTATTVNSRSDSNSARTKVIHNYQPASLFRPKPNVKFVDSRILSLHPPPAAVRQRQQVSAAAAAAVQSRDTDRSQKPNSVNFGHDDGASALVEGIYWSDKVERQLPKGFSSENVTNWRNFVLHSAVERMEEGCGRMQNRLLTLDGEVHACCRYRQNSDQIQGEIFSFYLSRLLGLENLAPSALALIQLADPKWMRVREGLSSAQWTEEKPVVLTQFIPNLTPAFIPTPLRDSKRSLHPVDVLLLSNSVDPTATPAVDVRELAQWSDLIVFDYLTANLDRMVNNLYNLQWNPSMMDAPAHNLVKDSSTGLLVFLDNESGLLHGYRLLDKYEQYHRAMLDSLCVFRRSTAKAIKRLKADKNVGYLLKEMFHSSEPLLVDYLPMMPDKSVKILNRRIERVFEQIRKCESLYPNSNTL